LSLPEIEPPITQAHSTVTRTDYTIPAPSKSRQFLKNRLPTFEALYTSRFSQTCC